MPRGSISSPTCCSTRTSTALARPSRRSASQSGRRAATSPRRSTRPAAPRPTTRTTRPALRRASPKGPTTTLTTSASCSADWGDAPDSYGTLFAAAGPRHSITPTTLRLGANVDAEANGQPSTGATLDDTTGAPDDEDAVASFPALVAGMTTYSVDVSVFNSTGASARLSRAGSTSTATACLTRPSGCPSRCRPMRRSRP